jgi:AcrR family transcriptional regulator
MPREKSRHAGRPPQRTDRPNARERLLDAALTLFAEKGYAAAGTQEIIDAAGVTKPVLYHHFESKEALFRHLVGSIYDATAAAWDAVLSAETDAVGRLRGIARVSFEGSARDTRLPRLLLQTHYGPPIAELRAFMEFHTGRRFGAVVEIMRAGISAGELRGGDATSLALLFCCIMDQHINVHSRQSTAAATLTAERADALVGAFVHGCGAGRRASFLIPEIP